MSNKSFLADAIERLDLAMTAMGAPMNFGMESSSDTIEEDGVKKTVSRVVVFANPHAIGKVVLFEKETVKEGITGNEEELRAQILMEMVWFSLDEILKKKVRMRLKAEQEESKIIKPEKPRIITEF